MDANEFFASLPRGKEDKPLLFSFGPLIYNRDEVDGLYYMLDRDLSGCLLLTFAKPMDPTIRGNALLDGEELPPCVLKCMPLMHNLWVLGVPLRGYVSEYGREYSLHVEKFADTDGNVMNPQDFTVKCADQVLPQEKDAVHEAVALQAAQDGIVLLKNEKNLLPLSDGTVMNLFGKGVNEFRDSAVGAGKINPRYHVDFVQAIRKSNLTLNEELVRFYRCDQDRIPSEEMLKRAKEQSDLALLLITRGSGENLDNSSAKGEYYLSDEETALLKTLRKQFGKVLTILNVGYPMDVTAIEQYSDAIVYCGFGGMLAGQALVDVLIGKVNPNGKLPDTWAKDYFDIPASRNFYDCVDKPRLDAECGVYVDTVYEEGVYVGYRYFDTFQKEVAYPFGYGLSYTTFEVRTGNIRYENQLSLELTVINTGNVPGKEAPQVYVKKPGSGLGKELCWFGKTRLLAPGEGQTFKVTISNRELSLYNTEKAAYLVPAGEYTVYAGNSSRASVRGRFRVESDFVYQQVSHIMLAPEPPQEMTGLRSKATDRKGFAPLRETRKYPAAFTGHKPAEKITYPMVKENPALAADFVAQMSVEELARVSVCASAGWGMEGIGEAGRLYKVEGYDLPDFPVSDGNSGVNLNIPNIGMPSCATIAASFDPSLMEQVGRTIGEEAKALGMPLILAPAMNLHRNPLNGRQPEYFSEDPYMAGVFGGYYCRGMESAGVGSCLKHMVANNAETARKSNQSIIGERALRELYLKPFSIAMEIQMPASVMTAYNACNGRPTSADEELLMGFLREENHFTGFAMTDWGSYDTADVAEMVDAGMSWITPGSLDDTYTKPIVEGVKEGRIRLERLQENVQRMIETLLRYA